MFFKRRIGISACESGLGDSLGTRPQFKVEEACSMLAIAPDQ